MHDDATVGLVIAKRRGKAHPAEQIVLMTLADFAACSPANVRRR